MRIDRAAPRRAGLILALLFLLAPAVWLTEAGADENFVAAWLTGAELQYEGEAQRAELTRGFKDMLAKDVAALKAERYADYAGNKIWMLPDLIQRHVVPSEPRAWSDEAFYRDLKDAAAIEAVHVTLAKLKP